MYRLHRGIMASGDGLYAAVRSFGPAAWYQPGVGVTGTLTASNWADQSGNGRDLAQGTAGNQPIYLPYSGTAYGYLPGVATNYFSTPDAAANDVASATTVSIRAAITPDDWTPGTYYGAILGKNSGGSKPYFLYINISGGTLYYETYIGGVAKAATSSAAVSFSDATLGYVRVDHTPAAGTVDFFTSTDGVTWNALGTQQSITSGAITDVNAVVSVGSDGTGYTSGKIWWARIYKDGVLAQEFSPSTFAETSTNGATAVASTGETWTLNSTGAKPAQIIKSASLLFDGTDDYLQTAAFDRNQPRSTYIVFKQISWTAGDYIFDGRGPDTQLMYQQLSSPNLRVAGASLSAENGNLAVGSYGIAAVVFNGAGGVFQINNSTALTGDYGSTNASGITLAARGGITVPANIQVKELIDFSAAHAAAERSVVQNYLAATHRIAL